METQGTNVFDSLMRHHGVKVVSRASARLEGKWSGLRMSWWCPEWTVRWPCFWTQWKGRSETLPGKVCGNQWVTWSNVRPPSTPFKKHPESSLAVANSFPRRKRSQSGVNLTWSSMRCLLEDSHTQVYSWAFKVDNVDYVPTDATVCFGCGKKWAPHVWAFRGYWWWK